MVLRNQGVHLKQIFSETILQDDMLADVMNGRLLINHIQPKIGCITK